MQANQIRLAPRTLPPQASAPIPPAGSEHSWWSATASLALVLALIVLAARVLRSRSGSGNGGLPPELVEVLGRSYLDAKQTLYVVRWGTRLLLVGSGPQGLRTLAELTDSEAVEHAVDWCKQSRRRAVSTTLRDLLRASEDRQQPKSIEGEGRR